MANTGSQAEAVRDLLVERLELYDPSLDVSEGSALWAQVVQPVFEKLGTDPFDTDIRTFLKDRIAQEFPLVSAQDGDALIDMLVTPLEVLLEPLKREIQIVRTGQSARYPERLRTEDARDLAANFFVDWQNGARASGVVRVCFAAPTYLTILPSTEFSTAAGLLFYPTMPMTIRPEQMILYRSGQDFYIDIPVLAADTGVQYCVAKGTITSVRGLTGYTRVTNLADFTEGLDAETAEGLLTRTRSSLTERTLNVRRGVVARIGEQFPSISDVEVVGYGDPEMERDILTGGGEGSVIASGVCFIVGQFVLMFSTFEDRGLEGATAISVGDEIELNFWSFLYDSTPETANEKFLIDTILFDSRTAITQMPSILLFRINNVPSITRPIVGVLPGVLPCVFAVVRSTGKIEISDIPGGILNPDTLRGTIEINDGEVHIGGHYDVWVRAAAETADSATLNSSRSVSALLEGDDLVVSGESAFYQHLVHRRYTVTTTAVFVLDSALTCTASGAIGRVSRVTVDGTARTYQLWEMNGIEFAVGDSITDGTITGTLSAVESTEWEGLGVERGMVLSLPLGNEAGSYRILKVDGPFLYVDIELTTTAKDQLFRILDEVSLDLFAAKLVRIPFGEALGDDLRTVIGSKTVRTAVNLQNYGVEIGDTLEILSGDDIGVHTIESWDSVYGGNGPVLSVAMTATNSSVSFTVYLPSQSVQRPLLRISAEGVVLLDSSGQDSGYTIPPAEPVDVRPPHAFSGSKEISSGLNGFVLMDPGSGWAPTADYTVDIATYPWTSFTAGDFEEFYTEEAFTRLYTDAGLQGSGYIAVISVHGSNAQMYLDSNLPAGAKNFLSSMRDWLLQVIATFGFGGDEEELVNAFTPVKFGPCTDTSQALLLQFEVLIPYEVFDGCNNVFMALPEFDWANEFADTDTFNEAIGKFVDGDMDGRDPALLQASAGDALTVLSGLNSGSYIIHSVHQYALVNARALEDGGGSVDLDKAYKVAMVVIKDEFPVPAFNGLPEFFAGGSATWGLPAVAGLPFTVTDNVTGNTVDGWTWVEEALTWFFQTLNALGFDLPESVVLDVPETLKAFWQLLFNSYAVCRPTAEQDLRLYFLESTSCTVFAPMVCARYQWAAPENSPGSIEGSELTLPLADLSGLTVSLEMERLGGSTTLAGTLPAGAGTAVTLEELAAVLQALLDPAEAYVVFSGPTTATGTLTITQVSGGVDELTYISAIAVDAGFRVLGFYGPEPAGYPETETSVAPVAMVYETIVTTTDALAANLVVNTTLARVAAGAPFVGSFLLGEDVVGTGGGTGRVWAINDDSAGLLSGVLWISDVVGSFNPADTVEGQTSHATLVVGAAVVDYQIVAGDVTDMVLAASRTFEDVATSLGAAIDFAIHFVFSGFPVYDIAEMSSTFSASLQFVDQSGVGTGPGRYEFVIEDTVYTSVVTDFVLDSPTPPLVDFVNGYVGVAPIISAGTVLNGMDYTPTVTTALSIEVTDGVTPVTLTPVTTYWQVLAFEAGLQALITAGDYEGAAQAMNADSAWFEDSGTRYALWAGTATELTLRGLVGGTASALTLVDSDVLGCVDGTYSGTTAVNWSMQGTTVAGDLQTAFATPQSPTIFVAVAGAQELLFTPSAEADPYMVFPGQNEDGDLPITELPRDVTIGAPYAGQLAAEAVFTDDSYEAPIALGVREESDWLHIYEQRRLLEHTTYEVLDTDLSRDRVVAVFTAFGSNVVTLPDLEAPEFTFLAPNSGLDDDQVQVGDVLFIEEGDDKAGYVVTDRSALALTLDRALTGSTERVYRYGNDGVLVVDPLSAKITSLTAAFTSDDIGRYLTIWASNRDDICGSFNITAVEGDGSGCTLDTDVFAETETDVHWAVVKAPAEDPGTSEIFGRTALLGLRPIRIYNGTPAELRIVDVTPSLVRAEGKLLAALDADGAPPKNGILQPYKIVRPGTQHISSTAMREQREHGLYYMDVTSTSLGGGTLYNIPEDTKLEPVFGTYESNGYRVEVVDSRYTFSTQEEARIIISPTFLPADLDDELSNLIAVDGRGLRIAYEYVPVVAELQSLLSSEADRVLCANALARHFLPSYVTFDVNYYGGNDASTIAEDLRAFINGLSAVDELDVSRLEGILHKNAVDSYDHPVRVLSLTHDLDRKVVCTQSSGIINDDNIAYNGTNRTTFFIAGFDASGTEDEDDLDPGARILPRKQTRSSTFR